MNDAEGVQISFRVAIRVELVPDISCLMLFMLSVEYLYNGQGMYSRVEYVVEYLVL